MTVTVKNNTPSLVVPPSVRRRAGIKAGDRLEFKVSGGIINIIPKLPSAGDEYTSAQRRIIDAELAEAGKSPTHRPFTAAQATRFLKGELKARSQKSKRPR
jgi:bifunctional DNA-binding transcriptional regulator/antitoxin component of YhaV-PrlF toxin-antitoxin module